jgi:hypothetical protein
MQNIILTLAIVLFTSVASIAQCDKKIKWQAAKAELLDESGQVTDTKEGPIAITTDSKSILIEIVANPNNNLECTVTESTCEWKEAFKNGKTTLKGTAREGDGETSPITFIVEGKDGKLTITVELEKMNGKKVRINVDKHEVI